MTTSENISPDYLRTDDKPQTNDQQADDRQSIEPQVESEIQEPQIQIPSIPQAPRRGGSY